MNAVTNVIIAGLGGQGVLKCSDILAEAAYLAGLDIKKAEVHGMSQRGGSVACDVRFGQGVLSPMVPAGEADYLVVLSEDQIENNRHNLKPGGALLTPETIDVETLSDKRSLNVALLGMLSGKLDIAKEHWIQAIHSQLPAKLHEVNVQAFEVGRSTQG